MARKVVVTLHSKVRYSERVDYRESMDNTLKKVLKYGIRIDDVSQKYGAERFLLNRNKIYFDGKIYVFANQNQYHTLLTVYPYESKALEDIYKKQDKERKKRYYKQMFTSQTNVIYRISLYKGRVFEVKPVMKSKYTHDVLGDAEMIKNISVHMGKLIKGKESKFKVPLYLEEIDEFEKKVYQRVLEIKRGQTVTYKELAIEFNITIQKLTGILKRCPIPVFIPTHRVIKSNGQIGSHTISKDLKKKILNCEKEEINKLVQITKQNNSHIEEEIKDDYLCYNISDLFKELL